jgi:hypothetical protein
LSFFFKLRLFLPQNISFPATGWLNLTISVSGPGIRGLWGWENPISTPPRKDCNPL